MRIGLEALVVALRRRPWTGLATTWLVCLLGWAALVGPTLAPPPPLAPRPSAVVVGVVPLPPAVVRLGADLIRARALGAEVRARLAAMPATLEGPRANPLHERLVTFQRAQDRLIATLERRLGPSAAAAGAPDAASRSPAAMALLRPALPLLVLSIGAGLGLVMVAWCARRDGVIAGVAQLERALDLPVLGQVRAVPAGATRDWACARVGAQMGVAGLLAGWALVTVLTVVAGSGPAAVAVG